MTANHWLVEALDDAAAEQRRMAIAERDALIAADQHFARRSEVSWFEYMPVVNAEIVKRLGYLPKPPQND